MKKSILLLFLLLLLPLPLYWVYLTPSNDELEGILRTTQYSEIDNYLDTLDANPNAYEESKRYIKSRYKIRKEESMLNYLEDMANTIILAEVEWGQEEITPDMVNKLYLEVYFSDYDCKPTLLNILGRWKRGYFDNAVHDHNDIWSLLGGTVGRAHKADYYEIIRLEKVFKADHQRQQGEENSQTKSTP